MKLTKAQAGALKAIERYMQWHGKPYSRPWASGTIYSVRLNVLEKLSVLGLIDSGAPMPLSFHTVTLTDAGRAALKEMGE